MNTDNMTGISLNVLMLESFCLYPRRYHYDKLLAAEQNNDDVDTVKYAKKRRIQENYFEGSSHHKKRGRSCVRLCNLSIVLSVNPSLVRSLIPDKLDPASTVFIIYCIQLNS